MKYAQIWLKVLSADEKVEYEFSVGNKYREFFLIIYGFFCFLWCFASLSTGILFFLAAWFYYGFYLKVSNAYAFTNKRVLIHKDWLSTRAVSIDYIKITDINVEEPFFDRILTNTGYLTLNTAGTPLSEGVFKHIESPYEVKKHLDLIMARASK